MTVDALGGALATYRRTASSRSAMLLIAANAIPLVGVLFFGWSLLTILVLYWVENGIVGLWNLPRIALARGSMIPTLPEEPPWASLAQVEDPAQAAAIRNAWRQAQAAQATALKVGSSFVAGPIASVGRIALTVFFLIHYGMFWFVHGIFVFVLPSFAGAAGAGTLGAGCLDGPPPLGEDPFGLGIGNDGCGVGPFGDVVWSSVALAAVVLFLSHGASFLINYLGRGEFLTSSPTRQMGAPYARVVVLHLTILLGAFVAAFLGAPIGALLVLVILKTAFDLGLHLREHRAMPFAMPPGFAGPSAPAGPA